MGGECWCCSWTCRPVRPLFILLAAVPVMLHSSQSPAAPVGKIYSRGNHWAVGHLMGKKSIESPSELQKTNVIRHYLTPSEQDGNQRSERLMEALMHPKNQEPMVPSRAERMVRLHGSWREEDREKHLGEMSKLLHLALELRESDST
ncbi:unnamed protein product [Ophioblennius macclurei]